MPNVTCCGLVCWGAGVDTSKMSLYDEPIGEAGSDSFWEVGNYKRTVKRIDDGYRLCNDLMACLHERARIEKAYATQLTEWTKKWRQLIEKGPQYGTVATAWKGLMNEADNVSTLHVDMRTQLMSKDIETIKGWQKDAFHKQMIGGFKETKEAEDNFRKAQKPWAKKLKEVDANKKLYQAACKEEKMAESRDNQSKTDPAQPPDVQRKLAEKVERCKAEVQKSKDRYQKVLEDLNLANPKYMEDMELVFDQCQEAEGKRLTFFKDVLSSVKVHLDLSNNDKFAAIYRELQQDISSIDKEEDLKWFRNTMGAGMPMNWPAFEEYSPDTNRTISKREKSRKAPDGVTLTNMTQAGDYTTARANTESFEQNQNFAGEWSDEEASNPFGGGTNGHSNPFEEDGAPAATGVRVRALYDYDGQEQDELTFLTGQEFIKLEDEDEQGWCKGRLESGKVGLYPANYVEPI
ncbi:protein kinase C and casein kinase substrate in neurons protein 2-like isoform X1 [Lampetra planeri]